VRHQPYINFYRRSAILVFQHPESATAADLGRSDGCVWAHRVNCLSTSTECRTAFLTLCDSSPSGIEVRTASISMPQWAVRDGSDIGYRISQVAVHMKAQQVLVVALMSSPEPALASCNVYNRTVKMRGHGHGLDWRTVERGRHRQSGELRLGRRRGVAYEARGYKQGWADLRAGKTGKPTAQIDCTVLWIIGFHTCRFVTFVEWVYT